MASSTPFYFEAVGASVTIALVGEGGNLPAITLQTSSNETYGWTTWSNPATPRTLAPGAKLYIRAGSGGNSNGLSRSESDYRYFSIEAVVEEEDVWDGNYVARCKIGGNLLSLVTQSFSSTTKVSAPFCFTKLFQSCERIYDNSDLLLRASVLSEGCYDGLFSGCINLTHAPSLTQVMTIERATFRNMFADCQKISGTVELPNPTTPLALHESCCEGMFANCFGITSVTRFNFGRQMKTRCFDSMFAGCKNLDSDAIFDQYSPAVTLASVSELADYCFASMFADCSGLTAMPAMPASSVALAEGCYSNMFAFCSALTTFTAFALPNTMKYACCRDMFYGCASILSDSIPSDLFASVRTLASECFQNMFSECYGLTSIPRLPGRNVENFQFADSCYAYMFSYCTALKSVTGLTIPSEMKDGCLAGIFQGCTSLTNSKLEAAGFTLGPVTKLADRCFAEMFADCAGLTAVPPMPTAIEALMESCFERMFAGCTGIRSAAGFALPAEMADGCCREMFADCVGLVSIGDTVFGSVRNLSAGCFYGMFRRCAKLSETPEIKATTFADTCCAYMFENCSGIRTAHAICDETAEMAASCFTYMFASCTHLTNAPALPATVLADGCYQNMFYGCTALTSTPALPATDLPQVCYRSMFSGCSAIGTNGGTLGAIGAFADGGTIGYGSCYGMFYKCTELTVTPNILSRTIDDYGCAYMFYNCTKLKSPEDGDHIIGAKTIGEHGCENMFYKCVALTASSAISASTLGAYSLSKMYYQCTGIESVRGIAALGDDNGELADHCCEYMFYGCTALNAQVAIKTKNFKPYCFRSMFHGCTAQTHSADFTSARMADHCCAYMYYNTRVEYAFIDNIVIAEYAPYCMSNMFGACEYLEVLHFNISNVTLADYCFSEAFTGCINLVQFYRFYYKNVTLATGCFHGMFNGCSALREAPKLDFTALTEHCYSDMFRGCTGLWQTPKLPAVELAKSCYENMFYGCENLKSIQKIAALSTPEATLAPSCCKGMFQACDKKLTEAPVILTRELADHCFQYMFADCSVLSSVRQDMLRATVLAEGCYSGMFENCPQLTSFLEGVEQWSVGRSNPSGYSYAVIRGQGSWGEEYCEYYLVLVPNGYSGELTIDNIDYFRDNDLVVGDDVRMSSPTICWSVGSARYYAKSTDNEGYPSDAHCITAYTNSQCSRIGSDIVGIVLYGASYEGARKSGVATRYESSDFHSYAWKDGDVRFYTKEIPSASNEKAVYTDASCTTASPDYDSVALISGSYVFKKAGEIVNPATRYSSGDFVAYAWRSYEGYTVYTRKIPSGESNEITYSDRDCTAKSSLYRTIYAIYDRTTSKYSYFCTKSAGTNSAKRSPSGDRTQWNNDEVWFDQIKFRAHYDQPVGFSYWTINSSYGYYLYEYMFIVNSVPDYQDKVVCKLIGIDKDGVITVEGETTCSKTDTSISFSTQNLGPVRATANNELWYERHWTVLDNPESGYRYDVAFERQGSYSYAHLLIVNDEKWYMAEVANTLIYTKDYGLDYVDFVRAIDVQAMLPERPLTRASMILPATSVKPSCYSDMFKSCTGLKTIPELQATNLSQARACYAGMFDSCSGIETIEETSTNPALKAQTLGPECYKGMFRNCDKLTTLPLLTRATDLSGAASCYESIFEGCVSLNIGLTYILPARTLAPFCYRNMFAGCTGLTDTPRLPATNLAQANGCYSGMFKDCTGLKNITDTTASKAISASTLSEECFKSMFDGCTGLTDTPILRANTLKRSSCSYMFANCTALTTNNIRFNLEQVGTIAESCCAYMFQGCTGITVAPSLPTDGALKESCYRGMFMGCTNLQTPPSSFPATQLAPYCYASMFNRCEKLQDARAANMGDRALTLKPYCCYAMFDGCEKLEHTPSLPSSKTAPSCFELMFAGCVELETAPAFTAGELASACCANMFNGCVKLSDASAIDLSGATSIGYRSCYGMFHSCSELETAPQLPSGIELAEWCYAYMFADCVRLTVAPALTVTELGSYSCQAMFSGCIALKDASGIDLSGATLIGESCCQEMFYDCQNLTGDAPTLPSAEELESYCFYMMFYNCQSLRSAPKIHAKKMAERCCYGMFNGCSGLTDASNAFETVEGVSVITELAKYCFDEMFSNCSSLTTPPVLPEANVELAEWCYSDMFNNCTALTKAPELKAPALVDFCYYQMFRKCEALAGIESGDHPIIRSTTSAQYAMYHMFYNCTSLSVIEIAFMSDPTEENAYNSWTNGVKSSGMLLIPRSSTVSDMKPSGWSVKQK